MSAHSHASESSERFENRHSGDFPSGNESVIDDTQGSELGSQRDRDEGYGSESQPDREEEPRSDSDDIFWRGLVDLDQLQADTQRRYPGIFTNGKILGWRGNGFGYSVIVGYQFEGKTVARVEPLRRRALPSDEYHISSTCRGKSLMDSGDYWTITEISSIGLIAWRVDNEYKDNPTAVLRPMIKAWYPETYIQVLWRDGLLSWESREKFRHIYCSSDIEADVIIYRMAIDQQSQYEYALTGRRPNLPDSGSMQNLHWRNTNAHKKAHWLTPRARKETRIVSLEEEPARRSNEYSHQSHTIDSEIDEDEVDSAQSSEEVSDETIEEIDTDHDGQTAAARRGDTGDDHSNGTSDDDDSDVSTQQTPRRNPSSSLSRSRSRSQSYRALHDTPTPIYTPAQGTRNLSPIDEEFVTPQSRRQPARHETPLSRSQTPISIFSRSRRSSTARTSAEPDHRPGQIDLQGRPGSKSARSERSSRSERPTPRPQTEPGPRRDRRYIEPDARSNHPSRRDKRTPRKEVAAKKGQENRKAEAAPVFSNSQGKERAEGTPSSSRPKGKERADSTPSSSKSKGKGHADRTPSSSKSKDKEHAVRTPSSSKSKDKEHAVRTPSSSKSKGKEHAVRTPSSSKSKGKERADDTPSSSRSTGKERAGSISSLSRSEDRENSGLGSTPSSSKSKGKERADHTPSSSKSKGKEQTDSTPSSSKSKSKHLDRDVSGSKGKKKKSKRGEKFVGQFRRPGTRSKTVEFDT